MLKQQTRERIQALVKHPDFTGSVSIEDKKIFHKHNNGNPKFYVDVNIHGKGPKVLTVIAELLPDMKISDVRGFRTEHESTYTFGDIADGVIESAKVTIWAQYGEVQKEAAPAPTGATLVNIQPNYTTESEVVANA